MPSSRDRQRKLAREKFDRQMARRAANLRRKRQRQAVVGVVLVLVLAAAGTAWFLGAFDRDEKKDTAAQEVCTWTPQNAADNTSRKDVGTPPTKDIPTSGTRPMTITTNQGAPVSVALDVAAAPCASASFAHLAGRNFFDNTKCHEITAEGALRCGDPGGTGLGGPTYSFFSENVPTPATSPGPGGKQPALYPKGTVALIGAPAGSNSSQFLVFFKDFNPTEASYPIVGRVTAGLDVVEKIGRLPTVDNGSGAKIRPKQDVLIRSLTVGEPAAAAPAATGPAATPTGRAVATTTPSAS